MDESMLNASGLRAGTDADTIRSAYSTPHRSKTLHSAELDHCEPHVRRLCQDLPDFDSVWLDALVQQRCLTAWQADQLQTDEAQTVVIGRFQRQRALGRTTWLATDEKRVHQYVLRAAPGGKAADADLEIEELFAAGDRLRSTRPAALTMPLEVIAIPSADRVDSFRNGTERPSRLLVSKFIPGWSMEELLIRGGRLPWEVVAEIGRELLLALTWLESARLLHGDLVLRNVRLDLRGCIHLVDPFARRLSQPAFALTDQLTLRDCDGVAPEQVGTGRAPDARSELYALGCLLWQLLTSRPVLLSADPVTRMMKQKDHDIADVRGPVPDCPEWMSRLIQSMTRRAAELRPGSSAEVLKLWKASAGNSLSHCRTLARRMPDHALRRNVRPRTPHGVPQHPGCGPQRQPRRWESWWSLRRGQAFCHKHCDWLLRPFAMLLQAHKSPTSRPKRSALSHCRPLMQTALLSWNLA